MAHSRDNPRLIQVKLALAEKYERLAKISNSRPKRVVLRNRANHYRRQVQELQSEFGEQPAERASGFKSKPKKATKKTAPKKASSKKANA